MQNRHVAALIIRDYSLGFDAVDRSLRAVFFLQLPADHMSQIQELHLPVYHWLSTELEETFFAD